MTSNVFANTTHQHDKSSALTSTLEGAIDTTRHAARQALDGLSDAVQDLRDAAVPLIEAGERQAGDIARQGRREWQQGTRQWRQRARRAGDVTVHYIQDEPVAAVMIAAATGATLMALAGLFLTSLRKR